MDTDRHWTFNRTGPSSSLSFARGAPRGWLGLWVALVILATGSYGRAAGDSSGATPVLRPPASSGSVMSDSSGSGAVGPSSRTSSSTARSVLLLTMNELDDRYRLQPGDRVTFRVVEDREDPQQLQISATGELEVPYFGKVIATNKTCKQLAFELKRIVEQTLYYKATVIIVPERTVRATGKVFVVGQVMAPGAIELSTDEPLTVSAAILKAGGFSKYANRKRVKVTRPNEHKPGQVETFYIDVEAIWEKGKIDRDIKVQPGDVIFVDRKFFNL